MILKSFKTCDIEKGAVWPSISALWVNWAVPLEKSRLIGFSSSGSYIGNIVVSD
jgi:hypothetical protein